MLSVASLWIPFTLVAAAGQVARNAMQRSLTAKLGTWGATNIRFLFGFPFSLVFLAAVLLATG
ncbi:MAG: EamA/RhaT family transporter, partial [Bradyrhizobium sp.]|nr:EamA/RhaT family transporter [Bradyrhizobium sp.]